MKKQNTVLVIALVFSVAVIIGLLIGDQSGKYSQHKWFEGHAEDVICDVMENYAYPGAAVSDVEYYLGIGKDDVSGFQEKILAMFGYQDEEHAGYAVRIYTVEVNRYFVVVHNGDIVLNTMLVYSLS